MDEFRDRAAECLDSARSVADRKARLELLALAKSYLDLADVVEGSERECIGGAESKAADTLLGGE